MLIYVHIISGSQSSPEQIVKVYGQPWESIMTLKKRILKTLDLAGNKLKININDWFITGGRSLNDRNIVEDYVKGSNNTIFVLKYRRRSHRLRYKDL